MTARVATTPGSARRQRLVHFAMVTRMAAAFGPAGMDDVPLPRMTRPASKLAPGRPGWLVHAAAVAWTAGIAVLLTAALPPPGGELSFAVQLALELDLDKLIHAGLVAVHALLLAPSFARFGRRRRAGDIAVAAVLERARAWAWAAACVWSMSFELVQSTLPARAASLGDALADLAGGVAVALWWRWRPGRTR